MQIRLQCLVITATSEPEQNYPIGNSREALTDYFALFRAVFLVVIYNRTALELSIYIDGHSFMNGVFAW